MRVQVRHSSLLADLRAFLHSRLDTVTALVGDDVLEVALLGSYRGDAMETEIQLRVRAWEARLRTAPVAQPEPLH